MMMTRKLSWYLFVGSLIFFLDRISKAVALRWCAEKACIINSVISGELVINRGIMSGVLHSSNNIIFFLVSCVIVAFTLVFSFYTYKSYEKGCMVIGQVCVIFGSLSNIVDRIVYGGVIDFILLSYNGYSWPVFNIADVAIVGGIGIMIIQELCVTFDTA